ncbi:MAG: aminotransferase class V-fold PLP-dependent enzyme [Actinobacteria bacterium]|nr:MAG: aminotransferase class V-fold PLP-dependent enzyme [Actinomycetota bacterium]
MTFEEARAQFPVLRRYAYLNAGTNGPLACATVDAMTEWNRRDLAQGRGGKEYFEQLLALREGAREELAGVLEVGPENVALVSSTTNACNVVLAGLDLSGEDEIVTTDVEHFGLLGPLLASPARVRVAHVRDAPPDEAPRLVSEQMTSRTKLIALSHVSWVTGNSHFPSELPRRPGVSILVDGAQTAGACPTQAVEFDFYTVSGQKWLCGPDSTGALYVRDPERLRVALPTYMSQSAYDIEESFTPKPGAARFDSVWYAPGTLAGLLAALEAAPKWRYERTRELAAYCRGRLVEAGHEVITAPDQAGLISFGAGDAAQAAARLYEAGVVVRDIPATGWLRVSCGWWTNEDDVERMLNAL